MERNGFDRIKGFTMALKGGESVDFRPVKPDDWQTIQNGMQALSAKSRYFRFFSPIVKLSDEQLHYFTEVDQCNHVAWIALAHDRVEHPGVGIARFIRFPNQPNIAEFAVTVVDRYQKKGIGTMLMVVLYQIAQTLGIEILRGFVLPENTVAVHWFERLGASSRFENDVCQMDIAVYRDITSAPEPPLLQYFGAHLDKISPLTDRSSG